VHQLTIGVINVASRVTKPFNAQLLRRTEPVSNVASWVTELFIVLPPGRALEADNQDTPKIGVNSQATTQENGVTFTSPIRTLILSATKATTQENGATFTSLIRTLILSATVTTQGNGVTCTSPIRTLIPSANKATHIPMVISGAVFTKHLATPAKPAEPKTSKVNQGPRPRPTPSFPDNMQRNIGPRTTTNGKLSGSRTQRNTGP